MKKFGLLPLTLLALLSAGGCSTGPTIFERHDKYSRHAPGSDAWWAEKATLPPGTRQKYKKGKVWPMRPRSTEEPQQFSHTFYSEHYWPLPYVCQDRAAIRNVFEQQTALGWQEETTLYDRHFNPETHQLNKAGGLHLEYILHVVPVERRTVFIQSTYEAETDHARTEAVNSAIALACHGVVSVPVEVRECQQIGRPAGEVVIINGLYNANTPAPRLGGAGGGGGAAAAPSGTAQ